jgi:hypothetical protein
MGEMRNEYKILVGKTEGQRQFGKQRRKRENNIKIDVKENMRVWIECM